MGAIREESEAEPLELEGSAASTRAAQSSTAAGYLLESEKGSVRTAATVSRRRCFSYASASGSRRGPRTAVRCDAPLMSEDASTR